MTDEEKQAIKMMKFYQDEYRKEIKTLKENGEPEGYGTMIDVYKGHIINIQFVLDLIEKQQKALKQKDKEIQELKAKHYFITGLRAGKTLMAQNIERAREFEILTKMVDEMAGEIAYLN